MTTLSRTAQADEPRWPRDCAEALSAIFAMRRRGVPLLPGLSYADWQASILAWSTGRSVRCVGVDEAAA